MVINSLEGPVFFPGYLGFLVILESPGSQLIYSNASDAWPSILQIYTCGIHLPQMALLLLP